MSKPIELLLVEDNAGDILLIKQALAGDGVRVSIHVAVDGTQAIQMLAARQFDPDLVILDLNIPKASGLAVLAQIQPEIPVVVFTSSSDPKDRRSSFDLGAKDYVQKPMDLDQYGVVISRIVRHWAAPGPEACSHVV